HLIWFNCLILVGSGSSRCSGRVEIYHSRTWGTVCDDGWDMSDAKVVCRQMDCGVAISATQNAHFGEGSGQIWLDEVSCSGSESSLTQCGHGGFGSHNCEHSEDAGVICSDEIRLVGPGSSLCSGRVEIYHSRTWGTVCDDDWDMSDAKVVCRQMGCGVAINATKEAHFGEGSGLIWLDDVSCSGNESSLTQCGHREFGSNNCYHSEDAGVICSDEIRLVGPDSSQCSGRVEIYHSGTWGTVCDDGWDMSDAKVVCRQMSCGVALSCGHRPFGSHDCGHGKDAGVICSGSNFVLHYL
uniref:SRCR domain-containing protein n=1 Tax=Periophthalmus magnuspinnatus TaxID=409849 RepID=A0A3B3ZDL6_9GOBI